MAIIFDSIYKGRNTLSIQVKAHEVHILPFEEIKSILDFKENEDDEDVEEVESEKEDEYYENDELLE